jgi:hypothetical protein
VTGLLVNHTLLKHVSPAASTWDLSVYLMHTRIRSPLFSFFLFFFFFFFCGATSCGLSAPRPGKLTLKVRIAYCTDHVPSSPSRPSSHVLHSSANVILRNSRVGLLPELSSRASVNGVFRTRYETKLAKPHTHHECLKVSMAVHAPAAVSRSALTL